MEDDAGASELSCPLCKGFLIDAVTLTLCSHSFCRSCLLQQLQKNKKCPECDNQLDVLENSFCRDTTLQAFVYKYVPSTFWKEIKQRSDFIKRQSPTEEELQMIVDWKVADFGQYLCLPDEMLSFSVEFISRDEILNKHHTSPPSTSENSSQNSPKKDIFCRYFRCPAAVKIKHLKSLLEGKLELPDNYVLYFIELESGEIIEECYSLQDLVYIFGWSRHRPLKLHFTLTPLVSEEDKPPVLEVELFDQSEMIDSGPPPLELEPATKMPAFTVNLSSALFDKEPRGNSPNGVFPRLPIITPATDAPPKKKRRMGPRKEKPSQQAAKRNSISAAALPPILPASSSSPAGVGDTSGNGISTPSSMPDIQSQPQNNVQTNSPSIQSPSPTAAVTNESSIKAKSQSPSLSQTLDQIKIASDNSSSPTLITNEFAKISTSPTLLTVEQSNKQLNQVFAAINSAPNTPIPNDFSEKSCIIPLSKSAEDTNTMATMQQQLDVVRTMKIHENNFVLSNRPKIFDNSTPINNYALKNK